MFIEAILLASSFDITTPVIEIGEGIHKVDVYQVDSKTCYFKYADKNLDQETLRFIEEVNCVEIGQLYKWRPR